MPLKQVPGHGSACSWYLGPALGRLQSNPLRKMPKVDYDQEGLELWARYLTLPSLAVASHAEVCPLGDQLGSRQRLACA